MAIALEGQLPPCGAPIANARLRARRVWSERPCLSVGGFVRVNRPLQAVERLRAVPRGPPSVRPLSRLNRRRPVAWPPGARLRRSGSCGFRWWCCGGVTAGGGGRAAGAGAEHLIEGLGQGRRVADPDAAVWRRVLGSSPVPGKVVGTSSCSGPWRSARCRAVPHRARPRRRSAASAGCRTGSGWTAPAGSAQTPRGCRRSSSSVFVAGLGSGCRWAAAAR